MYTKMGGGLALREVLGLCCVLETMNGMFKQK